MSSLTRTSLSQLMRQAEELLGERRLPPPVINIGFANGGPGEPGPNESQWSADYLAWMRGGALPASQDGLTEWLAAVKVQDMY